MLDATDQIWYLCYIISGFGIAVMIVICQFLPETALYSLSHNTKDVDEITKDRRRNSWIANKVYTIPVRRNTVNSLDIEDGIQRGL